MSIAALFLAQTISFAPQPEIKLEVTGDVDKGPNWVFFAPHQNENVVNDYVKQQIEQKGGAFIILRQRGGRHLFIDVAGTEYEVDPNRIFSDIGRKATLKKFNKQLRADAKLLTQVAEKVKEVSDFILNEMQGDHDSKKIWIAIHNNTNGYDNDGKNGIGTISIERYGKKLKAGAQYLIDVNATDNDEDDLYFVTSRHDFNSMRQHNFNAVLQNPHVACDPDEDDGSLSVLAEKKGLRYINVEAERTLNGFGKDHLDEQKQMVDFTFSLLESE